MKQHYVWLIWSSAFLIPWAALYLAKPALREVMWRASLATTLFGLSEPIFVPAYWNPLRDRIESLSPGAAAPVRRRWASFPRSVHRVHVGVEVVHARLHAAVWNLPALRGGLVYGIPTEELLFGFAFALYWSGVYEHFTWSLGGNAVSGI